MPADASARHRGDPPVLSRTNPTADRAAQLDRVDESTLGDAAAAAAVAAAGHSATGDEWSNGVRRAIYLTRPADPLFALH